AAARIDAPAKINLGLELLGRRSDGYHEIRTVMAMVGLWDRLEVARVTGGACDAVAGMDLGGECNLIAEACHVYRAASGFREGVQIYVTKHIPIAGGLGGASADGAATLLTLDSLNDGGNRLGRDRLMDLASELGSDVPFFLGSPLALAAGTGTTLAPLPPLRATWHAVLASPAIDLPRKTATLYGAITPPDYADGSRAEAIAAALRSGAIPDFGPDLLANPFRIAWTRLGDPVAPVEEAMLRAGAAWVALSGAGPTVYTLTDDAERAEAIAARLRER
ncbi:unnamed protein product, partial [Phaeothamnion confervicola]